MPPPSRCRAARASAITSAGPARSDPTGAHSPFDRQHITVVADAPRAATVTPDATSAWKSRAPSRWTDSPARRAASPTARNRSTGHTRPPDGMCVSSTHTTLGVGQWCAAASTAHSTSSTATVPSVSSTVWNCTGEFTPAATFS